jgi:Helix-turn-helix domain
MSTLAFTQLQMETFPEGVQLRCRYLRVEQAIQFYPWKRAKLYQLMNRGDIKSFVSKERGNLRGIRLIDRDSMDQYLERAAAAAELQTLSQEEAAA